MDHYEFHSKFTDKYGMGLMTAIARMDLSNEHIAIYSKWADEVGKPTSDLDKMFGRGETATLENCLEDCHAEVCNLVATEYFCNLSRETTVSLCNALAFADCKIQICENEPEFLLDADAVAYNWNKFNPDEKKITKNMDYIV